MANEWDKGWFLLINIIQPPIYIIHWLHLQLWSLTNIPRRLAWHDMKPGLARSRLWHAWWKNPLSKVNISARIYRPSLFRLFLRKLGLYIRALLWPGPADLHLLVGNRRLGGIAYVSLWPGALMTPLQKATLDSMRTLSWFVFLASALIKAEWHQNKMSSSKILTCRGICVRCLFVYQSL